MCVLWHARQARTARARVQQELSKHACNESRLDVWQRGVDTDTFHPRFRSQDMRSQMTDGHPEAPLLIHVGRLGAEKNLFVLKDMLEQIPGAHLAFVGDGPSREQLQAHFKGMPNVKFMVRRLPALAHSLSCRGMACQVPRSWCTAAFLRVTSPVSQCQGPLACG